MVSTSSRQEVGRGRGNSPGKGSDKTHARRRRREVAEEKAAEEARKAAARFGIDNTNTADADRHLVASQSYCEDIRQTRRKLPGEGSENTVKRRERRQCAEERAAKKARKAVAHSGNVDADPALTSRMDAGLPRTTFSPQLPRPEAHHLYTTILSALANRSQQCSDMEEEHHLSPIGVKQEPRESDRKLETATLKETGAQDIQLRVEQQMETQGTTVPPEVKVEPHENAHMPDDVPEIKQDSEEDVSAFKRQYPFLFHTEETVEIKVEG